MTATVRYPACTYFVIAVVAACMAVSSFFPDVRLPSQASLPVASAVHAQKVFLQVFSLAALPERIVDRLLVEKGASSFPVDKGLPVGDDQSPSAVGKICCSQAERRPAMCLSSHYRLVMLVERFPVEPTRLRCAGADADGTSPPGGLMWLFLLCVVIVLPRSDTGEASDRGYWTKIRDFCTQLMNSISWVFSLRGHL